MESKRQCVSVGGAGGALLEPLAFAPLEQDLPLEFADVDDALAAPKDTLNKMIRRILDPGMGSPGKFELLSLLGSVDSMPLRATCKTFAESVEGHCWIDGPDICFKGLQDWKVACPQSLVITIIGSYDSVIHFGGGKGGKGVGGGTIYIQDEDVEHLVGMRLKEVHITNARDLTPRSLNMFGALAELKSLTLQDLANAAITSFAPLRELEALRLISCDMRELTPNFADELPYLRILHFDHVQLTTPKRYLFAHHALLVDLLWKVVIVGTYTDADGTVLVDAEEDVLKGLFHLRKLVVGRWVPRLDYRHFYNLEELAVHVYTEGVITSKDFVHLKNLKRLEIINIDWYGMADDDLHVSLGDIISLPTDFQLLPKLTHLFIDKIDLRDTASDQRLFDGLPKTLKTMGWSKWLGFVEALNADHGDKNWASSVEDFFDTRSMHGHMVVAMHYMGDNTTLEEVIGASTWDEDWISEFATDLWGAGASSMLGESVPYFHQRFGCTLPWALK